ncbi:hypothetical protein N657DRAFT_249151 [Parathielavia appendiculata]|uniref:Uncharacterized protein n=1 Tax=Parathielavia appendiculata TaxID=2587402 RepID=A0AAN6TS74_9PEZI|nr:hypothetical protein N657DRAFT_249151 [Parathielavia appendiculata]
MCPRKRWIPAELRNMMLVRTIILVTPGDFTAVWLFYKWVLLHRLTTRPQPLHRSQQPTVQQLKIQSQY